MKTKMYVRSKILTMAACLLFIHVVHSQNRNLPSEKAVLVMKDGKLIEDVQLWEVHAGFLVYESGGNLHDALIADIERVRMQQAEYFFSAKDSLEKITAENSPPSDSSLTAQEANISIPEDVTVKSNYLKGYKDATKYYDGTGAAVGGFISGMVPGIGWFITMPVISATSPQMASSSNPNLAQLADKDYRAGYKKKATNKKLGNVFGGFAVGLTAILLVLSGSIAN